MIDILTYILIFDFYFVNKIKTSHTDKAYEKIRLIV